MKPPITLGRDMHHSKETKGEKKNPSF